MTNRTRGKVWIVDDSKLELELAASTIAISHDIELFSDGASVLERLAAGPAPDALILDWQLPGLTGIEICKFVRTRHDSAHLPILILTVNNTRADVLEALGAGANDYVVKPYATDELRARVQNLVRTQLLRERAHAAESREQRVRIEALELANRTKDEFLATVSHELRTPLNAILGWVSMLRGGKLPADRQARAFEIVERNARAQARLIDDLLDLSRVLSGKLRLDLETLDLARLVEEAVDSIRPAAETKQIALDVAGTTAPAWVIADANRLQQVLSNILSNALRFTPSHGRIEVSLSAAQDNSVELRVRDTGSGIEASLLPFIFDSFRQGDAGAARLHGGLGLGLAIARRIIEQHHGRIAAASEGQDRGATITIGVPRVKAPPPPKPVAAIPPEVLSNLHILLVEDDADARQLMNEVFVEQGISIAVADSAAAALAAIEARFPDVIISDVGMPGMSGLELMRRVRAMPKGIDLPAIALTAYARDDDRARVIDAGFDAHVPKPISADELLQAVARLVKQFGGKNGKNGNGQAAL